MNDTKYNGWSNYETWLTNLHFGEYLLGISSEHDEKVGAEEMKDWTMQYLEDCGEFSFDGASFVTDCVTGFLSAVDWNEIADAVNDQ